MKINWPFGRNKKPQFNINHPDIADKIEFAFKFQGKKYYRFKNEYEMPTGRYKWVMNYLREVDLRMDIVTIKEFMKRLKGYLDGSKGSVNLHEAYKIISNMESRLNLAFEPEGVRRLASVSYFDDSESLDGYDMKHNQEKIKAWREANFLDFFLMTPIGELLKISNISIGSLEDYIQTATQVIKDLTLVQSNPSQETISENGMKK